MKKILNTIFYSKFFIALIGSFIVLSCNEFLDVDTDTDSPTVAPIAELLPGVQLGVANQSDFGNYLGIFPIFMRLSIFHCRHFIREL